MYTQNSHPLYVVRPRIAILFMMVMPDFNPPARQIKLDSWFSKKFCVFLKRKISRGQFPRSRSIRRLLNILGADLEDCSDKAQTIFCFIFNFIPTSCYCRVYRKTL